MDTNPSKSFYKKRLIISIVVFLALVGVLLFYKIGNYKNNQHVEIRKPDLTALSSSPKLSNKITRITADNKRQDSPTLSGKYIAYVSNFVTEGNQVNSKNIIIYNRIDKTTAQITSVSGDISSPSLVGNKLFWTERDGSLYVKDLDSGKMWNLNPDMSYIDAIVGNSALFESPSDLWIYNTVNDQTTAIPIETFAAVAGRKYIGNNTDKIYFISSLESDPGSVFEKPVYLFYLDNKQRTIKQIFKLDEGLQKLSFRYKVQIYDNKLYIASRNDINNLVTIKSIDLETKKEDVLVSMQAAGDIENFEVSKDLMTFVYNSNPAFYSNNNSLYIYNMNTKELSKATPDLQSPSINYSDYANAISLNYQTKLYKNSVVFVVGSGRDLSDTDEIYLLEAE